MGLKIRGGEDRVEGSRTKGGGTVTRFETGRKGSGKSSTKLSKERSACSLRDLPTNRRKEA